MIFINVLKRPKAIKISHFPSFYVVEFLIYSIIIKLKLHKLKGILHKFLIYNGKEKTRIYMI